MSILLSESSSYRHGVACLFTGPFLSNGVSCFSHDKIKNIVLLRKYSYPSSLKLYLLKIECHIKFFLIYEVDKLSEKEKT